MNNILYFLHVPKTAGISLRSFLYDHFHTEEFYNGMVLRELLATPRNELVKYRLFCGHFSWFLPKMLEVQPSIITFLREPRARTISQYKHIKRGKEFFGLHEKIKNMSFADLFANLDEKSAPLMVNPQTSALAFDDLHKDFMEIQFKKTRDVLDILTDSSLLDKAIKRLESITFVGLTEEFDNSLKFLCYELGWPTPLYRLEKANSAPPSGASDLTAEKYGSNISKYIALDDKLYTRAKEMFNDRYANLSDAAIEVNYCKNMAVKEPTGSFYWDFKKPIYGTGWYGREFQENGSVYRWTGPGTLSFFDIKMDICSNYCISFFGAAYESEILKSVRLAINDEMIELSMLYPSFGLNKNECVFTATIPSEVLNKNQYYTRFKFYVSKTVCPKVIDIDSNDIRRLGLYVRWLEIYPVQDEMHEE